MDLHEYDKRMPKIMSILNSDSIMKTLEKYQRYSYGSLQSTRPTSDSTQSSYQDYLRLKATVEHLQRSQRNLLGEDLSEMNTKDLDQLENQLEVALRNIRSTKTQFMLDQLADLQNREKVLNETTNALRRKLEEISGNAQVAHRLAWEAGGPNIHYTCFPSQSDGPFQPLGVNPNLQIGYNPVGPDDVNVGAAALNIQGFVTGWML
ncbi:hypothetical protein L6164_014479 [Bauhinia variegata]|uniref:Uncharacterized protein n=1 Tax=Bauhinia variegata TaxID=167791 RepID=A0ACB9NHI0_BAUVA|nr:hypothetical protein L6164_014479 [Bauhinia variegata]